MVDLALRAIVEPRRREILRLVQSSELSAGEIASHFTVTRPAISQHLRILQEADLVDVRDEGTRRYYRARPEGLADLRRWLDEFWGDSLQRLKLEVEQEQWRNQGRTRNTAAEQPRDQE